MKIKQKKPSLKKRKRGFLFFPKTIDGLTRWLEVAEWERKYMGDGGGMMGGYWYDSKWLDIK